ncbi:hypothetical protein [Streptomyces sp. NPDC002545]
MNAQGSLLQGAKILESTPAHFGWTLLRLAAPFSFTCGQCHRTTVDDMVAVETADAGTTLVYCANCHRQRISAGASTPEPRAAASGAVPVPRKMASEDERHTGPDQAVVIQQPDPGKPHDVIVTESEVQWTFVIREHHLNDGVCPLPPQAVRRMRTVKVVHLHDGRAFPTVLLDAPPRKKKDAKERLRGIRWPQTHIMTGTRVTAKLHQGQLSLFLSPLERPVMIARKRFLYDYDPRIIARELPASPTQNQAGSTTSLDGLVQETIRKLGYLDEEGRALLPMENLISNVRSHRGPQRYSSDAVRAAANRLLSRRRLTWETGSCAPEGILNFPARPGERRIRLVCNTPFLLPKRKNERQRVVHLPSASSHHGVAGHLMKIDHLGKQASDSARAAYAEAHRRAGLAGSRKLPKGHTYVRPHERGGK